MKTGVKRTATGGLEFSRGVIQLATALLVMLATAATYGFVVYRKAERIDHAVQYDELADTVTVLRRADTTIARELHDHVKAEAAHHAQVDSTNARTSRAVLGLLCDRDGYPPSFCTDVPRRRRSP